MAKKGGKSGRKARTSLQKEYDRKYRNLEKRIESALKRGYTWEKPLLTGKPKKITQKSLQALENKNKIFYEKARYTDPETGKQTSGKRGREIERSRAGKKAAATRKARQQEEYDYPWYDDYNDYNDYSQDEDEYEDEAPDINDAVLKAVKDFLDNFVPTLPTELYEPDEKTQEERAGNLRYYIDVMCDAEGYNETARRLENNAEKLWSEIDKYIYASSSTSDVSWYTIKAIFENADLLWDEDDAGYGADEF